MGATIEHHHSALIVLYQCLLRRSSLFCSVSICAPESSPNGRTQQAYRIWVKSFLTQIRRVSASFSHHHSARAEHQDYGGFGTYTLLSATRPKSERALKNFQRTPFSGCLEGLTATTGSILREITDGLAFATSCTGQCHRVL